MPSIYHRLSYTFLIFSSVTLLDARLSSDVIEDEEANTEIANGERSLSFFDVTRDKDEEPILNPLASSVSDASTRDDLASNNGKRRAKCPYKDFEKKDECTKFNLSPDLDGDCLFNAGDNGWTCHWETLDKCKRDSITSIDGCYNACKAYHRKCCCPAAKHAPTMAPTSYCKYQEYVPNQRFCSQYNTALGKDCIFDAGNGRLNSGCRKTANRECDLQPFRRVVGCVDSCAKFHEDCCCPPVESGAVPGFSTDTFPPTISSKPSAQPSILPSTTPSKPPTSSPTRSPTSNPSPSPSITCPWLNFGLASRCENGWIPYLGGDCWFDASDDYGNCVNVSFKGCYISEVLVVDGCFEVCTQFHARCCCPPRYQ